MSRKHKKGRNVGSERTQFTTGNCANPWGRKGKPRRTTPFDAEAALAAHYAEPITISRDGKPHQVASFVAALCVLRAKALKGDVPALSLYFRIAAKLNLSEISAALAREAEAKEENVLLEAIREMAFLFSSSEGPPLLELSAGRPDCGGQDPS